MCVPARSSRWGRSSSTRPNTVDGPLTVVVYPGADGAFDLSRTTAQSFNYQRGAWMGLEMRWTDRTRRLSVSLARGSRMLPPMPRELQVRLEGIPQSKRFSSMDDAVSVTTYLRLRAEATGG